MDVYLFIVVLSIFDCCVCFCLFCEGVCVCVFECDWNVSGFVVSIHPCTCCNYVSCKLWQYYNFNFWKFIELLMHSFCIYFKANSFFIAHNYGS